MGLPREHISLSETWERHDWSNFDVYQTTSDSHGLGRFGDTSYPFGLNTQNHLNVRTFTEGPWTGPITTGYLASYNHWPGATATLPIGLSTMVGMYDKPLDLTVLGTNSSLTLALPDFPLADIDLTNSYIDLISDFTLSLRWSDSITTPIAGHSTLTWPHASLIGIDLTQVTGVRIRITATVGCTVHMMSLRLIGPEWVQTDVDFDNLNEQIRQSVPLNGDPSAVPVTLNHALPILWRTADVTGVQDPQPSDIEMGYLFNTGSQTQPNSFALSVREVSKAFITQLDLEGQPQANLTNKPQPTQGVSEKSPRTMEDLDKFSVGQLDLQPMDNLEALHDPVFTGWAQLLVRWGPSAFVQLTNSSNPNGGYKYSTGLTFANNTTYLAVCSLIDTEARVRIYNVDQHTFAIQSLHFDTTPITDGSLFPRRGGRIGFQATFGDGDSYVGSFHPRKTIYSEYRSSPLKSFTPVKGARLYTQTSPRLELFSGNWKPVSDAAGNQPTISIDTQKYSTRHPDNQSTRMDFISTSSTIPPQGITSGWLTPSGDPDCGVTDFDTFHISFQIWVPGDAYTAPFLDHNASVLGSVLVSEAGAIIPIVLPSLTPDRWQEVSLFRPLPEPFPISGLYQFILYWYGQTTSSVWIDTASIHQDSVLWEARSVVDDPWHANYAPWTPFHDTINSNTSGVFFTTRGGDLQVRSQALRQDAAILSAPHMMPDYAELGRLVWPEDAPVSVGHPTATITYTVSSSSNLYPTPGLYPGPALTTVPVAGGHIFTFDGSGSSSPNGPIIFWEWEFGDGNFGSGPVAVNTYSSYAVPGTDYTVTLTVTDSTGQSSLTSTIITL